MTQSYKSNPDPLIRNRRAFSLELIRTISPRFSCFSAIGRQGGKQRLSVGEGCEYKGTVLHEIMHALGFFHEHSRTDRDDYIMVLWWNIEPGIFVNKPSLICFGPFQET